MVGTKRKKRRQKLLVYEPKGAAQTLFYCRAPEVLIEGPAGTGKTRAVLEYIHLLCESFAGIRVLVCRQTLKSLRESIQITFERWVLPTTHESLQTGPSIDHRTSYNYGNGSHIALVGLDDPGKTFSSEFDIVAVFEAFETSRDAWEKLGRCMRYNHLPWQQRIADTNPASEYHWLNQTWPSGVKAIEQLDGEGRMVRLLSRHEDNPTVTEEYLDVLRNLTGARRARLYEGRWVSEEGQIWETFDLARHMISADLEQQDGNWMLDVKGWGMPVHLTWFGCGVDWGFRSPGSMSLYGVDEERRVFRVEQRYRVEKDLDWWAEGFAEWYEKYPLRFAACDPSRPDMISAFNKRIGHRGGREAPTIAREADNKLMAGLDIVRDGFGQDRIFFVRGACDPDVRLREKMLPTCTEEEIPSYVWREIKDGQPVKEEPKPDVADHGCDDLRYFVQEAWGKDLKSPEPPFEYAAGTMGDVLGHEAFLRKLRLEEMGYIDG